MTVMKLYCEKHINMSKFYVVHFRAYAQHSKRDPTYAQCYRLVIKRCLLVPQHVSTNSYAIIRGYYYKLHKMCIK
jgi:hypothetical protein